jgi:hypothetical protein
VTALLADFIVISEGNKEKPCRRAVETVIIEMAEAESSVHKRLGIFETVP